MSKQITTTEAEQLQKLIHAVKNKFEIKDIVFYFLESIDNWRERSQFVNALLSNNDVKQDIKDELQTEMKSDGLIVLKIQNMDKQSKLNDFLCSEIFPYYNEQQKELFA